MYEDHDIGMFVSYLSREGLELTWQPVATKPAWNDEMGVERKLEQANLSPLSRITAKYDNHMLCYWEFGPDTIEQTPDDI